MSTAIAEPTTYLTAHATPPAIKCPDWCVVTRDEHVNDLGFFGGTVVQGSGNEGVWHTLPAYVDGTPEADDPPQIFAPETLADGVSLDEAERIATRA